MAACRLYNSRSLFLYRDVHCHFKEAAHHPFALDYGCFASSPSPRVDSFRLLFLGLSSEAVDACNKDLHGACSSSESAVLVATFAPLQFTVTALCCCVCLYDVDSYSCRVPNIAFEASQNGAIVIPRIVCADTRGI